VRCEVIQPLEVHRFAAFAEMAVYVKRPEMQALCRAAMKTGGVVTPEAVRSVLPDASDVAIRNIIDWCREIGLCDGRSALTDAGEQAASEEGEAPLLEQGVYAMWGVEHAVLGGRVLHWERVRIDRSDEGTPAPLPMEIDRKQAWRSVITGKRFEVRDLPGGNSEPLGYTDPQHQSTFMPASASGSLPGASQAAARAIRGRSAPRPPIARAICARSPTGGCVESTNLRVAGIISIAVWTSRSRTHWMKPFDRRFGRLFRSTKLKVLMGRYTRMCT
jgi:hypothetical protein